MLLAWALCIFGSGCRAGASGCRHYECAEIALPPMTCRKTRGCQGGCQRVPTSLKQCRNAPGVGVVHFYERVPSGFQRVPTAPVCKNRTGAHDLLQNSRVPRWVPAGADFIETVQKCSWRGRCAFFGAGAERVPAGADITRVPKSHCRRRTTTNDEAPPLIWRFKETTITSLIQTGEGFALNLQKQFFAYVGSLA